MIRKIIDDKSIVVIKQIIVDLLYQAANKS